MCVFLLHILNRKCWIIRRELSEFRQGVRTFIHRFYGIVFAHASCLMPMAACEREPWSMTARRCSELKNEMNSQQQIEITHSNRVSNSNLRRRWVSEILSLLVSVQLISSFSSRRDEMCARINIVFVVAISASTAWNKNKFCFCQMNRRPNSKHSLNERDCRAEYLQFFALIYYIFFFFFFSVSKYLNIPWTWALGSRMSSFTVDTCIYILGTNTRFVYKRLCEFTHMQTRTDDGR